MKSNLEIREVADSKIKGTKQVIEEEWKGIIYYLYETEDAKYLEQVIVEYIRRKNFERQNFDYGSYTNVKKITREELNSPKLEDLEILYRDFTRIILDYQIKCRVKYLRNFVHIYKELDSDDNGILNEDEFIQLVANTELYNERFAFESNRLLMLVDPFNNKQVTFSDVITVFSNEIVTEVDSNGNAKKVNVLDKISIENYIISEEHNDTEISQ